MQWSVGLGTAIHSGRSWVRFLTVSMGLLIERILPAALGLNQSLKEMSTRNISWGVKVTGA
jgi:hypothetical protein